MGEKYRLNIPRLNVLSREKLELIHHSTLSSGHEIHYISMQ